MKKQQGFTLIELIIVIVILGVLGATAVPKFLSLSSDARIAAITGLKGALSTGVNLVYIQSVMEGEESIDVTTVTIGSGEVPTRYGYPNLHISTYNVQNAFANRTDGNGYNVLPYWMNLDIPVKSNYSTTTDTDETDTEWNMTMASNSAWAKFTIMGYSPEIDDTCQVLYTRATETTAASVTMETSGC